MKFLLLVLVIALAFWLLFGRRRKPPPGEPGERKDAPQTMLACAHCGVHLPRADALHDAQQRAYCSEAHRLAGPR